MTGRIGMDAGVIRELANQLDQVAGEVDGLIGSVEGTVRTAGSVWFGTDSSTFSEDWYRTHRPMLTAVLGEIHALANIARQNATQQDAASAAAGGGPVPGRLSTFGDALGEALGYAALGMTISSGEFLIHDLWQATRIPHIPGATVGDRIFGSVFGAVGLGVDTAKFIDDLRTKGVGQDAYNDEFNMLLDGAGIAAAAIITTGPLGIAVAGVLLGASALEARYPWLTADAMKYADEGVKDAGIAVAHGAEAVAHGVERVGEAGVHAAEHVGHFVSGGVRAIAHLF